MEKMKNVGLWIRVSTEMQVQDESPEHHEKRAKMYAEAKGWNVVTIYRLDALSGKSVLEYPETKRMLKDIKDGTITGIIFSKLARLARNTKELLEIIADTTKTVAAAWQGTTGRWPIWLQPTSVRGQLRKSDSPLVTTNSILETSINNF